MSTTGVVDLVDDGPRRVLVTGVGGFIGSHVAEALLARGDEVVGVDGFIDSYARWLKERNLQTLRQADTFRFVELDLRTDDLDPLLDGVDVVVNEAAFAGLPRSWNEVDAYVGCNLLAVARLVEAAQRAGVRRFVQASTSSVYGETAIGDELAPTRPVSPYGMSKLAAEHLVQAHVRADGLPAVILRYFSVYGPRQRPDMAYHIFIERLRRGEPITIFGDGHQSRSNTFISDVVAATLAATERGRIGEPYNVGGGVGIELGEAVSLIAEYLDTTPRIHHADARPGDQRVTKADVSKAREELGYRPEIDPATGLASQVRWHLAVALGDGAPQLMHPGPSSPVTDPSVLVGSSGKA